MVANHRCGITLSSDHSYKGPCSCQLLELVVHSMDVCFPYRKQCYSFNSLCSLLCYKCSRMTSTLGDALALGKLYSEVAFSKEKLLISPELKISLRQSLR